MTEVDRPLSDERAESAVVKHEVLHEGRVWDLVADTVDYNGTQFTREYLDHPGAVAVLALDAEDRVLLIRQYRHPVRARDWEIPAGLLDEAGEPALEAAKRELAEEADLAADRWDLLSEYWTTPGGSNEAIRIYLARDLRDVPAFDRFDEEADIEKRWVPLDEAVTAVLDRRIQNPSTINGVLSASASRALGWSTLGDADAPWPRHPELGDGAW